MYNTSKALFPRAATFTVLEVYSREKGGNAMEPLPPEALRAVPHIAFSIFNLAIPNIIAWAILISIFVIAAWARLPKIFGPES
jgi:hypothetical protein